MLSVFLLYASSLTPYLIDDSLSLRANDNVTIPTFCLVGASGQEDLILTITTKKNCITIHSNYRKYVVKGKGYKDTRVQIKANQEIINEIGKNITYSASEKGEDTIYFQIGDTEIELAVQINEQIIVKNPPWKTALYVLAIFVCAFCSFCFSGLNISLLSIDLITLDIMQQCGNAEQKKQATDILSLRTNDNLLICTDLFGNTLVNTTISVLLSEVLTPFQGFIISSTIITLVGEIFPQTFMYRYQLESSYYLMWYVKFWVFVLFIFCYPLSWMLRFIFGESSPQKLSRKEFAGFIQEQMNAEVEYAEDEKVIATNALELPDSNISSLACSTEKIFSVSESDIINKELIDKILNSGFSRIPVKAENNEIQSIILVKKLLYIDTNRNFKVADVIPFIGIAPKRMLSTTTLYDALKTFVHTKSHFAVIEDLEYTKEGGDPIKKSVGIVSLNDIIEAFFNRKKIPQTVQRQITINDLTSIFTGGELSNTAIDWVAQTLLMDKRIPTDYAPIPVVSGASKYKKEASKGDVIMTKGTVPTDLYIVIQGRVEFQNNTENFKSMPLPFSVFGTMNIYGETKPILATIVVESETCTYLQIPREELPLLNPDHKE